MDNNIKKNVELLLDSDGEDAAKCMMALTESFKTKSNEEKKIIVILLESYIEKASEKRQGSLAFLISFLNPEIKIIKLCISSDNRFLREGIARGMMINPNPKYISIIKSNIDSESSFRTQRHMLYALKNIGTSEAFEAIKAFTPPPELFIDYSKLIPISQTQEKELSSILLNKNLPLMISAVPGLEYIYLKTNKIKGEILYNGYIAIGKGNVINDFIKSRFLFGLGIVIGSIDEEKITLNKHTLNEILPEYSTYSLQFSNEIRKEKKLLSMIASDLHKGGFIFSKHSHFSCRIVGDEIIFFIKSIADDYEKYLPASINRVVAANILQLAAAPNSTISYPKSFIDLCAGAGSFLIEASFIYPKSNLKGFDIDKKAVSYAKENQTKFKKLPFNESKNIQYNTGDGRNTHLPSGSAEIVLFNPPFGQRVKVKSLDSLYENLVKEAKRILTTQGYVIAYTTQKKSILKAAKKENLILRAEYRLYLRKSLPSVFVFVK